MDKYLLIALLWTSLIGDSIASGRFDKTDLFTSGEGGYAYYRIPGIIVTHKGTILAYCEARRDSVHDWSTLDVMVRRSIDGGLTWSGPHIVSGVAGPIQENPVGIAAG